MSRRSLSLLVSLALAGCGVGPDAQPAADHAPHVHTRRYEVRPTQGAGHLNNGYGEVPVSSLASAGGHVRVWWAEEGPDRPPVQDSDGSGVPDFVEEVARVADEVVASLEADGFRLPVRDLDRNDGDFGGDDRFDIYLKNMSAADGYVVAEGCQGVTCSGYLVIENDFRGLAYASWAEAIRVLVSHEFFHAVQNAYFADVPAWVSEGGATWHEEHFYAPQDDFERLASYYLASPKRSLTDRNRGPTDAFAYGAGLFYWSLELAHDEGVARAQLEQMAAGLSAEEALDAALKERGDSLAGAFARFSVWNLFTRQRAAAGQGYPQAQELRAIELEDLGERRAVNWLVDPDPMAAHHAVIFPGGPVSVEAIALAQGNAAPTLAVVQPAAFTSSGAYTLVAPGQRVVIDHDSGPLYLIALNDGATGRRQGRVQLRAASIEPPMEPEPDMPADMDDAPDMGAAPDMDDAPDMSGADMAAGEDVVQGDDSCAAAPPSAPRSAPGALLAALLAALACGRRRGRA